MRQIFAGLFVCCSVFSAQADSLPQVRPTDADGGVREMTGAGEAQTWRAVGRLDTGTTFCSATLIAPDLVLTAAHCLFHPTTNRQFDASDLTFLAGLRNGRAEAIRGVRRTMVLPEYDPGHGSDFDMIGLDIALLELAQPVSATMIVPISTGRGALRDSVVTVVSYGAERESYASIEEGCEILERQSTVRSLSCQVVSGSSGSPVLRVNQGRAEVIGVISAIGESSGEEISLAVMLDGHFARLLDEYQRAGPIPSIGASSGVTTRFTGTSEDGREDIGARFIRP